MCATYLDERCVLSLQAGISTLSLGSAETKDAKPAQPRLYTANKVYSRYTKVYW